MTGFVRWSWQVLSIASIRSSEFAADVDDEASNPQQFNGSYSSNPVEVQEKFGGRWLTTDFKMGDLLVFTMHTMHCSLDNRSAENRIRLSVDSRYQPAAEEADERWVGENPIGHSGG